MNSLLPLMVQFCGTIPTLWQIHCLNGQCFQHALQALSSGINHSSFPCDFLCSYEIQSKSVHSEGDGWQSLLDHCSHTRKLLQNVCLDTVKILMMSLQRSRKQQPWSTQFVLDHFLQASSCWSQKKSFGPEYMIGGVALIPHLEWPFVQVG